MAGSWRRAADERKETGRSLPEEVQLPIRERLRMLRTSRNKRIAEIKDFEGSTLSNSTLTNFELHDISTMQLVHLWSISKWLNVNFGEMVTYLVEPSKTELEISDDNTKRIVRYLAMLDEEEQRLACDLVFALVENRGKKQREVYARPVKPVGA